ncbi:hypothetical protein [Solicola sp. PLA-1-18]|uniref:hypothetical protein n=1 Tax=Solicola sp. PLA-1-18 TaxID=3380532 RepID=UPI003B7E0688
MTEILMLRAYLVARYELVRRAERGASAIEWAIISAIVVTLALGVYAVINGVVTTRSQEISNGG